MKGLLSLVCGVLLSLPTLAQFFNNPNILGFPVVRTDFDYGQGVTIYDINLDGYDDLTFVQRSDSLLIFESTGTGFILHKPLFCLGEAKQALYGDYDNDGDADLVIPTYQRPLKIFRNDGNWEFTDVTADLGLESLPQLQSFGASWGDINNDGWLDLFVANYDEGTNGSWLFLNNQGINFTNVSNQWGVNVGSDFSFQGTFFDHNMDGKQDLHIANDRYPADALLVNYNHQFFLNEAVGNGFDVPCDGMCSAVADYNHDGQYDIYVTNNPPGNKLWEKNAAGYYTNVAQEKGVSLFRACWGATWIDWNNDSWEDLFVNNFPNPGDDLPFFLNNSGTFIQGAEVLNYANIYSYCSAKGDFNNDGYPDMAITPVENVSCKVLFNQGGDNHYIKFRLVGQVSNRDGIGTHVQYALDENSPEQLVRYTRAGDGYLSQDSQWYILGLGEQDTLHSLQLNWLSGVQDVYTNLKADTAYVFYEGFRNLEILSENALVMPDSISLCSGENITLFASSENDIMWNDGTLEPSRVVNETGTYSYTSTDAFGIINYSDTIFVEIIQPPNPQFEIIHPSCHGAVDGLITFSVEENWALTTQPSLFFGAGEFAYQFISEELCTYQTTVSLVDPLPLELTFEQESIYDSTLFYNIVGGTPPYTILLNSGTFDNDSIYLTVGTHEVTVLDANACDFSIIINVEEEEEEETVGLVEIPNEHSVWFNRVKFDLSMLAETLELYGLDGRLIQSWSIQQAFIERDLTKGVYFLVFKSEMNQEVIKYVVE